MAGKRMRARYNGNCRYCETDIRKGQEIIYERGLGAYHVNCRPSGDHRADNEYYAGLADGQRYHDDKAMYGEALAERWQAEEEFNRYWKLGEDY